VSKQLGHTFSKSFSEVCKTNKNLNIALCKRSKNLNRRFLNNFYKQQHKYLHVKPEPEVDCNFYQTAQTKLNQNFVFFIKNLNGEKREKILW